MSKSTRVTTPGERSSSQQTILPTAHIITSREVAAPEVPLAQTTEAEVFPASYTENDGLMVQDAIPLASGREGTSVAFDEIDRAFTRTATRMGRIQAEQERDAIARASRDIKAVNYFANAAVEEGNRIATFQDHMERSGFTTTVVNDGKAQVSSMQANKKEPEFYPGTYGKDYEVNPYEIGEYDTKDYETSAYKSVYDS